MSQDTRARIREQYSHGGEGYDRIRIESERGSFLTRYDLGLFESLLPALGPRDRVLEVGAGTGRFTLPLIERGCRVVATDVNEAQLETLREKLRANALQDRCEVTTEDIFSLSFEDGSFDMVTCLHVIPRFMSLEDQRAGLLELCRVLRPGGALIVNFRNRRSPYNLVYRGPAITPREFEEALSAGGVRIEEVRSKHLLNGSLLDRVPRALWPGIARLDRALETRGAGWAWDLFVRGRK